MAGWMADEMQVNFEFLNQADASLWLALTLFFEISFVLTLVWVCVFVCVCMCIHSKGINKSGVIQTMCDWLNLFYGYDTIAIDKVDEHGLSNTACRTFLAKRQG